MPNSFIEQKYWRDEEAKYKAINLAVPPRMANLREGMY